MSLSADESTTRKVCEHCQKPLPACLCSALHPFKTPVKVTVWQDPTEAKHKLSTTPLIRLNFPDSRLLVADTLNIQDVLSADEALSDMAVVYPFEHKEAVAENDKQHIKHLLILDGTWRKVRRLLHLNSWLRDLPHIRLIPEGRSQYHIRQSPRTDGLSTLEALVQTLKWLDSEQDYTPALMALQRMVAVQQDYQGG